MRPPRVDYAPPNADALPHNGGGPHPCDAADAARREDRPNHAGGSVLALREHDDDERRAREDQTADARHQRHEAEQPLAPQPTHALSDLLAQAQGCRGALLLEPATDKEP